MSDTITTKVLSYEGARKVLDAAIAKVFADNAAKVAEYRAGKQALIFRRLYLIDNKPVALLQVAKPLQLKMNSQSSLKTLAHRRSPSSRKFAHLIQALA